MGGSDVLDRITPRALGPASVALSLAGAVALVMALSDFVLAAPAAVIATGAGITLGHLSLLRGFRGEVWRRVLGAVGLTIGYLAVAFSILMAALGSLFLWMIVFAPAR